MTWWLIPSIVAMLLVATALSLASTAKRLQVPPRPASKLVSFDLLLRVLWAWWLVFNALILALVINQFWVVWITSIGLTVTGLVLLTRSTREYARLLIEEGADRLR